MTTKKEISHLVVYDNGQREWQLPNGGLHREDGPACENVHGYKSWWLNAERHREDGPAVIHRDGYEEWWYHGRRIECETQEEFERLMRLKAFW